MGAGRVSWGEAWTADAVCAQTDPEAFFPEKGGTATAAKAVCRPCPVAAECLEYALSSPEPMSGVWGGTVEHDRRVMRRARGVGVRQRPWQGAA